MLVAVVAADAAAEDKEMDRQELANMSCPEGCGIASEPVLPLMVEGSCK